MKKGEFYEYLNGEDYFEEEPCGEGRTRMLLPHGTYLLRAGVTYDFDGSRITPEKDLYVTVAGEPPADAEEILELSDYELPSMTN